MQRTLPVTVDHGNLLLGERIIAVSRGSGAWHNLAIAAASALNLSPWEEWRLTNFQTITFTYFRSKAAVLDGITFNVEWSETLAPGGWRQDGVLETEEDYGNNPSGHGIAACWKPAWEIRAPPGRAAMTLFLYWPLRK